MGDVVNLNKYRKQKAKAEAAKRAETNRLKHGRTRGEREHVERKKHLLDAKLDQSRLPQDTARETDADQNESKPPPDEPEGQR